MKILKTIVNLASYVVYAAIAVYLLIAAPMVLGYRPVVVLSGSMEPTYPVGSVIYYKDAPFGDIAEGDAITFHAGDGDGALVTHRVVRKNEVSATFVTKGDANETEDINEVSYDRVAGKVWKVCLPMAGYLINFGKQITVIAAMGGIILISLILDVIAPDKKKKPKEHLKQS